MAKRSDLLCFDACIIIDCLLKDPAQYQTLEPIILQAEAGNIRIVASVICRAEVIKLPHLATKDAEAIIEEFFRQNYVIMYAVNETTALEAGRLRRLLGLQTADAIHLATAIESKAEAFITSDEVLLKCRNDIRKRLKILTPKEFFDTLPTSVKQAHLDLT
jgi:predicted nucleic acid-binding protein